MLLVKVWQDDDQKCTDLRNVTSNYESYDQYLIQYIQLILDTDGHGQISCTLAALKYIIPLPY